MANKKVTPAQRALKKLRRKGRGSASGKLAQLVVDDLLARPMEELAPPEDVARRSIEVLRGLAECGQLETLVAERVDAWHARLAGDRGRLLDWLTDDARARLEEVLAAPYAPDPEQTLRAMDQEAMRNLVRRVLRETLTSFARRMRPSVPESRVLKGIGRRARKLAQKPRERLSGLGDGVVGMVGGEVERQMERRVGEFVDGAVGGVLRRIAEYVGEPANLEQFGQMRVAVSRIVLDTHMSQLAGGLDKLDRDALVAAIAAYLRGLPDAPDLERWIQESVSEEAALAGTFGEYLDRGNILDAWTDWARTTIAGRTRALAETDGFGEWLEGLIGD